MRKLLDQKRKVERVFPIEHARYHATEFVVVEAANVKMLQTTLFYVLRTFTTQKRQKYSESKRLSEILK